MFDSDLQWLCTLFVLFLGAGGYLRIVGKEKRRREKWLHFRLEEKLRELKAQQGNPG